MQNKGYYTEDDLKNNYDYGFWTSPEYVAELTSFVNYCSMVPSLVAKEYTVDKTNRTISDWINDFVTNYSKMYQSTTQGLKDQLTAIKESYNQSKDVTYTDTTSALNEVLRRQNLTAKLSNMSDDQLKDYVSNAMDNLFKLPDYDQQQIIEEVKKRGIDYSAAELSAARDRQYESDPNYQKYFGLLKNAWTVQPNGQNTFVAYFAKQPDDTYTLKFVAAGLIKQLSTMTPDAAADKINELKAGLTVAKHFESGRESLIHSQALQGVKDDMQRLDNNSHKYEVADNDPRINEQGSHWNWSVYYTFLSERFGQEPELTSNPIYSDPTNPNYDIDKRYNIMKNIYLEQKRNNQYRPLKLVDVPNNKNPEELDDNTIEKLFGEF